MRRFILIFLWFSLGCAPLVSESQIRSHPVGLPVVVRTELADAPTNGPVFAITRAADGTRWVGSNLLAVYDGLRWETVALPHAYAFRGVAPDSSGRVWIGAIGALGYLERNGDGKWEFTSLLAELQRDGGPTPNDIWHAYPLGEGAVFVTTDWILRWNGQKFTAWHCPGRSRLLAFSRGDQVVIYQEGVGLLRLGATGDPALEFPEAELPEHPVTWYVAEAGGKALLGLADSAYQYAADGKLISLPELTAKLRGALPSCAIRLRENLLAIGTFKQGVIFTTAAGLPINAINESGGLGDDSVYHLALAPDGTLAVGLTSGTASIEPPDNVTAFDPRNGFRGTPIKVFSHRNLTYALTAKTVYAFTSDGPVPTLGPEPRLWDAAVVEEQLWIGGFGGLWRKNESSWIHEYHVSSDVSRVTAVSRFPEIVVFFEGYVLKALQEGSYGWVARELGASVDDTPLSLLEDSTGDLWVSTRVKGIYRFTWFQPDKSQPPLLHLLAHYRNGYGLPITAAQPQLVRLDHQLFAFCADEILQLNQAGTGFEPVKEFNGLIGLSAATVSEPNTSIAYWLVQARALGSLAPPALVRVRARTTSSPLEWTPIRAAGLHAAQLPTRIDSVDSLGGAALWLSENSSLLRLCPSSLEEEADPPPLRLLAIQTSEKRWSSDAPLAPLPSRTRNLTFFFQPALAEESRALFYQTQLSSAETEWSLPFAHPAREYHGLSSGDQVFSVRGLDRFGRVGPPVQSVVRISAPAYQHPIAWGAYGMTVIAMGLGFTRWRSSRLRKQNERLNELVTERTRELELSNTAKSEFLENVSHEIRNPLNGLTGMLELLREGDLKPAERELAQSLKACADNLTRVSEEILGYSKIEYGYVALHPKPFQVEALLNELVALFRIPATQAGTFFKIEIGEGLVDGFVGDSDKIRTILGNFIGNALKYAPGGILKLTAEASLAEGNMVDLFFEVTDQGPGIPSSEQELIFQKFIRGSAAKKSRIPGTGLGLATCRMLAKAMNGSVGLETPPAGGATFYLRVLVDRVFSAPAPEKIQSNLPIVAGKRALIVDDEPYNRTVLQGVALELGFAPILATSAQEAISALAVADFEVVFLDWELPGAKGDKVARHLRAQPKGEQSLVIATTAHDSDEIRRGCAESGMDGFLLKPYTKERIRDLIGDLRQRRANGDVGLFPSRDVPSREGSDINLAAFALYSRAKAESPAEAQRDYIAAVEEELSLIHRHVVSGKSALRKTAAHRLRALAGLIGAQDFSRVARQLEADDLPETSPLLQELDTVWARLKNCLAQSTERLSRSSPQ